MESDIQTERSIFAFYRRVLALRNRSEAIRHGTFRMLNDPKDNFFVYERALGDEKYIIICNFDQTSDIEVPEGELLISNYDRKGREEFRPFETAVYKI